MRDLDHPARLRVVGLAATALMAAGSFGAGALPGVDPGAVSLRPADTGFRTYWLGFAGWLVGLVLLALAWWRLGRTVNRRGRAPSTRWLLLTGALWALPLLFAPPLGSRDVYAYACQGALWLDGVDPYSTGVAAGGCPWVDAVPTLWRDTPTPYGPLAVALSGAVVALARAVTGSTYAQLLVAVGLFRVVALAGGVLIAGYVTRLARACAIDPAAATWLGLLSPLVAIHLVSGAHNDALMVGLVVAAMALAAPARSPDPAAGSFRPAAGSPGPDAAWARWGPPAAAGAVLGLATAVKVTALVAVPFVVLLATIGTPAPSRPERASPDYRNRARPGYRDLGGRGAVVIAASLLVFAGLTLATGLDLGWIWALRGTGELVQWTSPPTGLGMAAGYLLRVIGRPEAFDTAVAVARVLGIAALIAAVLTLLVRGWRALAEPPAAARRGVVIACGSAFAAFALLSPVFYPWYGLTAVVVLAGALSEPRWRRRLTVLVLVLSALVLPNGLGLAVLTKLPGALLDVVLVAALAVTAYRARQRHRATAGPG